MKLLFPLLQCCDSIVVTASHGEVARALVLHHWQTTKHGVGGRGLAARHTSADWIGPVAESWQVREIASVERIGNAVLFVKRVKFIPRETQYIKFIVIKRV